MKKILFFIVPLISISSHADRTYSNREYGFSLNIPSEVKVVENTKQELSEEEVAGLIGSFGVSKEKILEELNSTFLTIGYYSGSIEEGK